MIIYTDEVYIKFTYIDEVIYLDYLEQHVDYVSKGIAETNAKYCFCQSRCHVSCIFWGGISYITLIFWAIHKE